MEKPEMSQLHMDSATQAFVSFGRPRENLSVIDHRSIQSAAVDYWLCVDEHQVWGPSMLPPPALRPALAEHGIVQMGQFALNNGSPVSRRIAAAEQAGDVRSRLWLARLYLQAGITPKATRAIEEVLRLQPDCEEAVLLRGMARTADSVIPFEAGSSNRHWRSPAVEFMFHMVSMRYAYVQASWQDLDRMLRRASEITESIAETDVVAARIARIRLNRYFCELSNDMRTVIAAVEELAGSIRFAEIEVLAPEQFLELEAARRFVDRATIIGLRKKEEPVARLASSLALRLDPWCARSHLLYAVAHRREVHTARKYLASAAALGVLERRYARRMASPEGALQRNYRFKELPIFPSHTDSESYEPGSCARIAARYRPFLEIRPPGIDAPLLCHAPLMLYRYLESEHVEYFGSVTLQRAMVLGFREELRSSMHGQQLGEGAAEGLVEWRNSPNDGCRHVFEMWSGLAGLPAATRAKVIKLITALGFFTEAREAVEGLLYEDRPLSPDEFYLHVLRHYVVNLTDEPGSYRSSLGEELSATVQGANSDPRILRMLLNLSVYGMVQSARRKDVQGVEQWRDNGCMYLARYTSRDEVSDFESHLMTSRYWRAATFLPYLTGDHDALVREFQLVLDHAHAAEPGSDQEVILRRENLIPAYESASRTYQAIGCADEAIEYMERASAVDPLDSKVLLQVGDLYQRRSDFETASGYFDRAAAIAVPHGALSWFRAGRARHLAGDHAGAIDRYLRSVQLQPAGVSNYRNIMSIAREQSDTYLHSWAASALAGQKRGE
ncbi:hypothetical protein [Nocardia rhamnosiphila]